ncbi:MAG TPA: VanW family protein, partial [Candidatus Limnocylindrales bacterium]
MSTVTDIGPGPATNSAGEGVAPRRRGRRVVAGILLALVVLVMVAGVAAAAALYAWDAGYEGRVLPGVTVGGIELSGKSRDEAAAAIAAAYPFGDGRLVLRTPDGDVTIAYAEIGRRPDTGALVDAALAAGRTGDLLTRAVGEVRQALEGTTLPGPAVLLDEAALASRTREAVGALHRYPVSATITMTPEGIAIGRARSGRDADAEPVIASAAGALRDPAAADEIVIAVHTTTVRPRVEDAAVFDARTQAVRMARAVRLVTKDRSWTIKASEVRSWIRFAPAPGGRVVAVLGASRIAPNLTRTAKAVKKPAANAQYLVSRAGKIVGVVASSAGRKLDRTATVAAIVAELERRAEGAAPTRVKLRTTLVAPTLGTDEAARKAPVMSLLGSWQTWFPISERNYFGANIWVPARLINGTVLRPGQSFDWWDAIWPVTTARGFGPGGFIASDHTEPTGALGGGMCSSSTTLFNAAMRAGLDMGARSNHKYYISRYPLGLDATVSITAGGRQTMSFRNDTKGIIFIRGTRIRSGGTGWVRYEIWGIPDGRTVRLSGASVWNVRRAITRTVDVSTLPKGVREQVE